MLMLIYKQYIKYNLSGDNMNKKHTMLLADDSKVNRIMLSEIFKDSFKIYEADNGEDALNILNAKQNEIDIILLDIIMPKIDGHDFLRIKSGNPDLADIPVVVITAASNPEDEIKSLDLGAVDFISNPFNSKIVKHRVLNIINNSDRETTERENLILRRKNKAQQQLQTILDNMLGGVALTEFYPDGGFKNLYESKGFSKLKEYIIKDEFSTYNFVHLSDRKRAAKASRNAINANKNFDIDFQVYNKSGEIKWINLKGNKIDYSSNYPVLLSVSNDITNSKNNEDEIRYRAEFDKLTDIYNQETFYSKTSEMIKDYPQTQFVIIYWNIERFKIINDLFGTAMGDKLLYTMGQKLKNLVGTQGTYGRISADHFAICIDKKFLNLKDLCEKSEHFFDDINPNFKTTVCFGIYDVEDINLPVDNMCDRANLALQKIKGDYSIHYAYYDKTLRDTLLAEQEIYNDMTSALKEHQFEIYIQPIIDIHNHCVDSGEILIRWNHPQKGLIPPNDFIPLFEKNGFIKELDYFVWEEACKFLSDREQKNLRKIPVSVNISRVNVQNPNLCSLIIELTKKYNIDPNMLKLEITESAYIDNPQELLEKSSYLQSQGFTLAMDDFGSGYSSLNHLKDFPVDILKIDMQFLGRDTISPRSESIITSVINMSKRLNIQTVAEGVETKSHVEFLDSVGCDRLQGYYFSRPVTVKDFNEFSEHKISYNSNHYSIIKNTSEFDLLKSKSSVHYLLFGKIPYGVSVYSINEKDLTLIYANDSYLKIMGHSSYNTDFNYKSLDMQQQNKFKENCFLVAQDKKERTITFERTIRNTQKLIRIKISYLDENSEKTLITVTAEDITEQTDMQNKIYSLSLEVNKSKNTIIDTFEKLPCAVIEIEIGQDSSEIVYHNDYAADMLGYSNKEFEAEIAKDPLYMVYDDDKAYAELLLEYYVQVQEYTTYEIRLKKRDNSIIWVMGKINLVNINNQSFVQNAYIELTDKLADKHNTYTNDERIESYYQYLHPLYKNIPCAIVHYTVEDEPIVIDFNDVYLNMFKGYETDPEIKSAYDSYIGSYMRNLVPSEIYDFDSRFMKYRKEHLVAVNEPITINTDNGKIVHALLSCNIIDLPDGTKAYQDIYKLVSIE